MRNVLLIALIGFAVLLAVLPSHAQHRLALVIGSGTHHNVTPLAAPGPANGPLAGNPTFQLSQNKPILPAPAADLLVEDVPLPGNVSVSNAQNLLENFKRFSGAWVGAWGGQLHHILIVENVMADGKANVIYAVGDNAVMRRQWQRLDGTIVGNALFVRSATYELTGDGKLDATYEAGNLRPRATMSRIELADLTRPGATIWQNKPIPPAPVPDLFVEDVRLPGNVSVSNPQNIPENFKQFSGAWVGAWNGELHHILIVESVTADGKANVVYAVGDDPVANVRRQWRRLDAIIVGNTLRIERYATYELTGDGKLDATFGAGNLRPRATMSRIELADLTRPGKTFAWTSEFLGTAPKENGKPIRPEKPLAPMAQQSKVPVVGVLSRDPVSLKAPDWLEFRRGLAESGFFEGQNITFEFRVTGGNIRWPQIVDDLLNQHPAVILAVGGPSPILELKAATSTVPIVFLSGLDPIRYGFVESFNRPGGNVTGMTFMSSELIGKRLNLLLELVPQAKIIGNLSGSADSAFFQEWTTQTLEAAKALGRELVVHPVRQNIDIRRAFANFAEQEVRGITVDPVSNLGQAVVEFAARYKIPAVYGSSYFPRLGGLMSYNAEPQDMWHQLATQYVARILKGTKPADLPIQQPTKFELVINLRTAKALGLSVPTTLLARADEVIDGGNSLRGSAGRSLGRLRRGRSRFP
jgi:putative tryptophan/tyrosine transport system substrate-binding protein